MGWRWAWLLPLLAVLAACAVRNPDGHQPDALVAPHQSRDDSFVALITVINTGTGAGEHSALLINGSQQVIYDPAGSFRHERVERRRDVLIGMTPGLVDVYYDHHARLGYFVQVQRLDLPRPEADLLIARAADIGPQPMLRCAWAVAAVLDGLPRFEQIPRALFPNRIARVFARQGSVETTRIHDPNPRPAAGMRGMVPPLR